MQKLRSNSKYFLWLMVVAFLGWIGFDLGADLVGKKISKPWERGVIAKVAGREISYELFSQRFQLALDETLAARGGGNLTPAEEERIENMVWMALLDDFRWQALLEAKGLRLSDNAVLNIIAAAPPEQIRQDTAFYTPDGQFNFQAYLQVLQDPRNASFFANYELQLRAEIPRDIMRLDMASVASASLREVRFENQRNQTLYDVLYVAIPYRSITDLPQEVDEAALRQFYRDSTEQFEMPKRVALSVAFFRKVPNAEDTAQAKERALVALEEIKIGTPFADAAKYNSDDFRTAESGGLLGVFTPETTPPQLRALIDTIPAGVTVGPVLSRGVYELYYKEPLAGDTFNLRHISTNVTVSPQTEQETSQRAKDFQARAAEVGFEAALAELGVKSDTTGLFGLDQGFVPLIGPDNALLKELETAGEGSVSELLRGMGFFAVYRVDRVLESGVPPYDEAAEQVKTAYLGHLRAEKAKERAARACDLLKGGASEVSLAQEFGPEGAIVRRMQLSYAGFVPGVNDKAVFFGTLAGMPQGGVAGPVQGRDGSYALRLVSVAVPEGADLAGQEAALMQQQAGMRSQRLFVEWQKELSETYPAEDYRSRVMYR